MLFGASIGKAILGVILEMKNAYEVNRNDTKGMKNRDKNTSGRVRASSFLFSFCWGEVVRGHGFQKGEIKNVISEITDQERDAE